MKKKRLFKLAALGFLVVLLTGCVWLRLLDFKNQLADLEHTAVISSTNGLRIQFREPALYAKDLSVFGQQEPAGRITNKSSIAWLWVYEKQKSATNVPEPGYDMVFETSFEKGKLREIVFPDRFLTMLPKSLTLGLLQSVGRAEINIKKKTAFLKWNTSVDQSKVLLPTRTQVTASLGSPFVSTESRDTYTWTYKYCQKTRQNVLSEHKLVWVSLVFDRATDRVVKCRGALGNLGWWVTSRTNKPGVDVRSTFISLSLEPVALKLDEKTAESYVGQYQGPAGDLITIGREESVLTASGTNGSTKRWCVICPETPNIFFSPPGQKTRWIFNKDSSDQVTNLLLAIDGKRTSYKKLPNPPRTEIPSIKADPNVGKSYSGVYSGPWGLILIRMEGDQLYWLNFETEQRLKLYASSTTNFFFKAVDCPVTFTSDEKGVKKMILHYNGKDLVSKKI